MIILPILFCKILFCEIDNSMRMTHFMSLINFALLKSFLYVRSRRKQTFQHYLCLTSIQLQEIKNLQIIDKLLFNQFQPKVNILLHWVCDFLIIKLSLMSDQSESRFGSKQNYYNQTQLTSSYQPPLTTNNNQIQLNQSKQKTPLFTFNHSKGYEPPVNALGQPTLDFLLVRYKPDDRIRIKNENLQKYNMNPQSLVYKFPPSFLRSLIHMYPSDFQPQMQSQTTKSLLKFQKQCQFYLKLILGSFLYWITLRRKQWFILTGSAIGRVFWLYIFFNHAKSAGFNEANYIVKNAFAYHTQYENVLRKYNIEPSQVTRVDLL